ncbi:hypothetical protein LTR85_002978 [Meristemomyces frigidus]|nr:hypothetical protein LTR85_002978 [Meristemomyces frigidus]
MAATVPPFYRTFFATIDPVICFTGILLPLFAPDIYLKSFSPTAAIPPAVETRVCLDNLAAWFTACFLLQVGLLRARPNDLTVWRFLQAAILIVDVGMLAAYGRAFHAQGRTKWSLWRLEEWANILVTVGVATVRTAFLMGVGVGRSERVKRG